MKKLIKMYNEKYGNTLGVIDDDFNKEQMYRIYYFIKNNCDDKEIQARLEKIKLDKPKTLEQQLTKLEGEHNKVSGGAIDPTIKTDVNNIKDEVNKLNTQYKDIANKTITDEERNKLTSLENYDDTSVKNDIKNIKNDLGTDILTTTAQNIKGAINEIDTKAKDMAKKTIIEGNKIYLAKNDGTKLDTGTILPTGGTGGVAYDDTAIKADINNIKTDLGTGTLTTTAKDVKGAVNELDTQCKELASKIASGNIGNKVEPLDDDLPNVYITGTLPTAKTQGDLPITIHYISKTLDFKNYATLKVQGASSVNYPKKNFTLKLYKDEQHVSKDKKEFKQWGKLNKFVLKAHWMDCSHVRNVGTAKIWGKIAKSRSDFNALPEEFKNSPNAGATDGFTVRVFANGIYQGLYEWIVPKDKLFGQDSNNVNHSILNSERNDNATCAFNTTTPNVTTSTWSEELQDTLSPNIATSFSNLIKFVAGSNDTDFIANAENYFDVQSVIDYDIFARIFCIVDNLCRNQIFFTYDGIKWYEGAWDLDAVLGLPPLAKKFYAYNTEFQKGYIAYADYSVTNMLYQRVETLFMDRFKARYNELRADILSIEGILHVYEKLTNVIKTYDGLLEEDYASTTGEGKFIGIPFQKENNIQQIRTFISKRLIYMDEYVNNTYVPVPCTNITLNTNTLTLTNTTPQTLIATLTPTDTTDAVVWTVNPGDICSVANGVVTPIKNGECVVTATCGTQSATCNITVSGISEQPTPDGLLLKLDSSSLTNSSTTWEDLSGNGVNFNLSDGTPSVSDKGLLMSSVKARGITPITLNGVFSEYYCICVSTARTGAFCSYNIDNLTKYCDSTEGGKLRINGYSGDITTTINIMNPDKLQKIVIVHPSEGNTQIYLNGVSQGTYSRGTFAANGNYDLVLGTSSYSKFGIDSSNLTIKEFQIFNRALSAEEAINLTTEK